MKALFDTNILIDYLNAVKAAKAEIERPAERFISIITWMEVLAGAHDEGGGRQPAVGQVGGRRHDQLDGRAAAVVDLRHEQLLHRPRRRRRRRGHQEAEEDEGGAACRPTGASAHKREGT